jgi:pimeloyl-ACP methyl ester carboxylesterase
VPHLDANGLRFHMQALRAGDADDPERDPTTPRAKVVMIHGLVVDNLSSYYYTIANPMALVADTYLYDLRGHGRSDMPKTGYTVVNHVADLRSLLGAWDIDEPVHLVGSSFGGAIALAFTRLFPEKVASLILIEAHFASEGWGEYMAGTLALAAFGLDEDVVQEWIAENGTRKLNRLARHSERLFLETSMIDDLNQEQPMSHRVLEAIECPALAIYGDGSDILDRAHDLEDHIPHCELHIVPDCTHSVLFEATPFVRETVLDWVTRHHAGVPTAAAAQAAS